MWVFFRCDGDRHRAAFFDAPGTLVREVGGFERLRACFRGAETGSGDSQHGCCRPPSSDAAGSPAARRSAKRRAHRATRAGIATVCSRWIRLDGGGAGSGREQSVAAMSAPSGPRSRGLVPASPVAEVTPDVHRKNGATSAGALLTGVFAGGCIARRPCRTRSDTAADCDGPRGGPRICARSSRCRKGRYVPTPAGRRSVRQGVASRHV